MRHHRNNFQFVSLFALLWIACNSKPKALDSFPLSAETANVEDTSAALVQKTSQTPDYDTILWVDIEVMIPEIHLDIKYATADNFTKKQIYDCPRCLLRKDAAWALREAFQLAAKDGFGMKIFDCYRPAPYQQRLWDVVPDDRYVANPAKGSMHSRGAAIDLTLIAPGTNTELDMGTPYDYFGREAHPVYKNLDPQILQNRERLASYMTSSGFKPITSEWWHFDFGSRSAPLAEFVWDCK